MYRDLLAQTQSMFERERHALANSANFAALVYHGLPALNWAGFYFVEGEELVLGPFCGKPACVRIGLGKGVCGAAAQEQRTVLVEDVHAFPGHIACDAASNSEIVVPLIKDGALLGVFDVDSPVKGRFDTADQAGMEALVAALLERTAF
ncbi:MAG: GAF domain-containing protein [Phycisphaerales bacterium JB038]